MISSLNPPYYGPLFVIYAHDYVLSMVAVTRASGDRNALLSLIATTIIKTISIIAPKEPPIIMITPMKDMAETAITPLITQRRILAPAAK